MRWANRSERQNGSSRRTGRSRPDIAAPQLTESEPARRLRPGFGAVWQLLVVDLMLFSCCLVWGVNVTVSALILRHLQPVTLAVTSSAVAAVAHAAITLSRERRLRIPRREIPLILLPGGLTIVSFLAYFYALTTIGPASVALLFGTTPLLAMLLTTLFGSHALAVTSCIAAILGLCGVTMVVVSGGHVTFHHVLGSLEGLIAALTAAGYTVVLKPLARRHSPSKLLAYAFGVSAAGTAAVGFRQLAEQQWSGIPAVTWLELLCSVALAFVFAEIAYVVSVRRAGPVRAATYTYLVPVFGVLSASVLLAARLPALALAGAAVIVIALAIGHRRDQPQEKRC